MNISKWMSATKTLFKNAGIQSASLDTVLLLEQQLKLSREKIEAHPEIEIGKKDLAELNKLRNARLKFMPMAYILGKKEFYGREFTVNRHVLIPRPETESIIELAKQIAKSFKQPKILDVGTGSGCIGITLALEVPTSQIILVDVSKKALTIARKNAKNLGAKLSLKHSNLLANVNKKCDIIVANLPYVDKSWEVSKETCYEPSDALFAKGGGLELIYKLIKQSTDQLEPGGYLVLEADPVQHQDIINEATDFGFKKEAILGYGLVFKFL